MRLLVRHPALRRGWWAIALASTARLLSAQATPELSATPAWEASRHLRANESLSIVLSRAIVTGERLAWFIGPLDVTALIRIDGRTLRFDAGVHALPAGDHEVVLYDATHDSSWREIVRAPIRVLTRGGLVRASLDPGLELSSAGQLAQRVPAGSPPPGRARYQDVTATGGITGQWERPTMTTSATIRVVAASEHTQRLRSSALGRRAPVADLADLQLELRRGASMLRAGHVQLGTSRHLVNAFASRGVGGRFALGGGLALSAGMADGASRVGWDRPFGVGRSDHRVATAALDWELVPTRPGAIALSTAVVDAAVLPIAGFTQGAVNDAERSRGGSMSLTMIHPSQRLRVSMGLARSDFRNPTDPTIAGDTSIVAVRRERRHARYVEGSAQLLDGSRRVARVPVALLLAGRLERVDPMYRSITAPSQADVDRGGLDLSVSLGAIQLQGTTATARDNLDDVPSILTTHTRSSALSLMIPGAAAFGATTRFVPSVTASLQRTHQYGDGIPENSGFAVSSVPDQVSRTPTVVSSWNFGVWSVTYRWNAARQDNRQAGRERADFHSEVHAFGLQAATGAVVSFGLDASVERQRNLESGTTSNTRQFSTSLGWRPVSMTAIQLAYAPLRHRDDFAAVRRHSSTGSAELSQGLGMPGTPDEPLGRAFVRYSWSVTRTRALDGAADPAARQWTLSSGLSLRLR